MNVQKRDLCDEKWIYFQILVLMKTAMVQTLSALRRNKETLLTILRCYIPARQSSDKSSFRYISPICRAGSNLGILRFSNKGNMAFSSIGRWLNKWVTLLTNILILCCSWFWIYARMIVQCFHQRTANRVAQSVSGQRRSG